MKLDSPPKTTPLPAHVRSGSIVKRGSLRWLMGLLLLTLFAGGGYFAYRQMVIAPQQQAKRAARPVAVERANLPITIAANGTVQPERSINVSPKTAGRLKSLIVKEGDRVQAGQILAYMDASDLEGQLLQAQGQLAAAEANRDKTIAGNRPQETAQTAASLSSAQATLRQAEDDLSRNQQLYTSGAISAQALNTARTTRDDAAAKVQAAQQALSLSQAGSRPEDVEAARAQVTQAQGALQNVRSLLNDAVIRAPFSGIVTSKFADPGDFVTPTTSGSDVSSATSSSILSLASTYQVIANVAETDIAKVRVGQSVTIKADAYPDKTFVGRVAQVAAEATVTQNVTSFKVRVNLPANSDRLLRPGMNVDAEFNVGKLDNALVIPTVAIVRQENGTGVLVQGADGKPVFTPIVTGVTVDNQTEVRSGLQGNEKILVTAPRPTTGSSSSGGNRSLVPGFPPPGGGSGGGSGGRRGG